VRWLSPLGRLRFERAVRTIQKYMRGVRSRGGGGQSWATFLKKHAERMWVCDFIQNHDLLFRQVYAFFLVHLASRRVVHVAATRSPTQAWTAQLRNAAARPAAPHRDAQEPHALRPDTLAHEAPAAPTAALPEPA
jgi:hypothetical protein